jgi:hypothetical protein
MMEYWNTGMMGRAVEDSSNPLFQHSIVPLLLIYTWWNFMAGNSRHVSAPP